MIFDYVTLKVIWWCFVGVLLIGFALTDGFDFGVGMCLPFLGKDDTERLENARIDAKAFEQQQSEMKSTGKPKEIDWMERITEMENTPEERCLEMIHTHEKENDAIVRKSEKILNYAMEAAEAGTPCPV